MGRKTQAKREYQVEVRTVPVPMDEMADMIIRALFGCSPAEAAKICIDEMNAMKVTGGGHDDICTRKA